MNRRDFLRKSTLAATVTIALPVTFTALATEIKSGYLAPFAPEPALVRPKILEIAFAQDSDDFAKNIFSFKLRAEGIPEADGTIHIRTGKVAAEWLDGATPEEMRDHPMLSWIAKDYDLTDAEITTRFI